MNLFRPRHDMGSKRADNGGKPSLGATLGGLSLVAYGLFGGLLADKITPNPDGTAHEPPLAAAIKGIDEAIGELGEAAFSGFDRAVNGFCDDPSVSPSDMPNGGDSSI